MHSINFITAHDGFPLADLVAFNTKHNDANGEGNRCGTPVKPPCSADIRCITQLGSRC